MSASGAPVDPLSGPGFDALWSSQIEPQLAALEGARRQALRQSILIWLAFAGGVGLEALLTGWLTDGRSYAPSLWVLFPTVIAAVLVGFMPLNRVALRVRTRLLQTLLGPMGMTYQADPPSPSAFGPLVALGLLPAGQDRAFDGMLKGQRGGLDFMVCETRATVRGGSGGFQGQIFALTFPRRFQGVTLLMRQEGWQTRFQRPSGLQTIGLEDPTFDRIWITFGDDQVEARAVLTPAFMQRLVALESACAGKNIRCAFTGGQLMIAVDGPPQFLLGSMLLSLDNRAKAERLAANVAAMFALIDVMAAATA